MLHRIDRMLRDAKGRPLRRVTRYVERRPSGAVASVVLPDPGTGAPPAVLAPTPAEEAAQGEQVELEKTDTVQSLRRELAEAKRRIAQLEARPAPVASAAALEGLDPAEITQRLQRLETRPPAHAAAPGVLEGLARHGERLAQIEAALAALGAAAAAAAEPN